MHFNYNTNYANVNLKKWITLFKKEKLMAFLTEGWFMPMVAIPEKYIM